MKSYILSMLDHQQTLLQNYRSLTVMFQTFLLAAALVLFNYAGHGSTLQDMLATSLYVLISIAGALISVVFANACWIRAQYVDALQNILCAVEREEIVISENFPLFLTIRNNISSRTTNMTENKIDEIIGESKKNANSIKRGPTRFAFTYIFHGTYVIIWPFFAADSISRAQSTLSRLVLNASS